MQQNTIVIAVIIVALVALVAWFAFHKPCPKSQPCAADPCPAVLVAIAKDLYQAAQSSAQMASESWARGPFATMKADPVQKNFDTYTRALGNAARSFKTVNDVKSAAQPVNSVFQQLFNSVTARASASTVSADQESYADAVVWMMETLGNTQVILNNIGGYTV